jgi:hypothetical protein
MNFPARRHELLAAIKRSIKRSSVATALYRRFTNEAATQTGRHFAKSSLSLPVHQTSKPDENPMRTYFNSHRQGPGMYACQGAKALTQAVIWIVSDSVTHADAIVVLGGNFQVRPWRARICTGEVLPIESWSPKPFICNQAL